jgi:hypothetical protein
METVTLLPRLLLGVWSVTRCLVAPFKPFCQAVFHDNAAGVETADEWYYTNGTLISEINEPRPGDYVEPDLTPTPYIPDY